MELAAISEALADLKLLPVDSSDAAQLAGQLERLHRQIGALQADLLGAVDRDGLFVTDGHRSARAWAAFTTRIAPIEASRRLAVAAVMRDLPAVADAFRAGELGTDQIRLLANVRGNVACRQHLPNCEALLLDNAMSMSFTEFDVCVRRFVQLADQEGRRQKHDTTHRDRHARFTEQLDGGFHFEASFGPVQGVMLREIFEQFTASERTADWEAARAEHGDNAKKTDLGRTEAQRRADAVAAIFLQAAETPAGGQTPEPIVNIVMSKTAFDAALDEYLGNETTVDPRGYRDWMCETIDGTQLTPTEAFTAALAGRIRRIVLDLPEASISKAGRLFTGPLRRLLDVLDRHCTWPGCHTSWRYCQGDHTVAHRHGGPTAASNGGLQCGHHNRWKERGYRTRRDPNGTFHTYRPDGTEIIPET